MLRTIGSLALAALLFAVPSTVRAQGPENKKEETDLKVLKRQLEDASKKLGETIKQLELRDKRIAELEDQVKSYQVTLGLTNEIKAKMAELDKALAKLPSSTPNSVNTYRPAFPEKTPGRVLLVNYYRDEMTFVINDKGYVLAPQSNFIVEVPPGRFSYKVVYANVERASNAAVIQPGQTYTLDAK